MTLGTSEKGERVEDTKVPPFRHLLIVFGGVGGLEAAVEADPDLQTSNPGELFQSYLNVCPEQGSRTIRTEEALLVALATLRAPVLAANR